MNKAQVDRQHSSIGYGKGFSDEVFYLEETAMSIQKGDIYYADLRPVIGSEQGGIRPVLVIQNDMGNRYSPTVIVAAITSQTGKHKLPTHIPLEDSKFGLRKDSIILLEQVRTIDRSRLKEYIGRVDNLLLGQVDRALAVSFGMCM
jgi:mRNA interferase MazF